MTLFVLAETMSLFTQTRQSGIALGLLLLALLGTAGLYWTRDSGQASRVQTTAHHPLVDEQPLQTARAAAKLAASWDEERLAQQALKLADHEVDLAFSDALRNATEHPPQASAQSRELYARLNKATALVKADQDRIDSLKKELATAHADRQNNVQQQLDIVTAQLELDQDELDDAKEDLGRSGLDPLSRIQRQFARHEAAQQVDTSHSQASPSPALANFGSGSLASQSASWRALHGEVAQLRAAENQAAQDAAALSQAHDVLEKQVKEEKADQQALAQEAAAQLASAKAAGGGPSGETTAAILSLHALSADQKDLADLDKRIQDQQGLSDAYASWITLVDDNERAVLHGIVKSALWILLILLAMFLAEVLVERFLSDLSPEQKRFRTVRVVVRFTVRGISVLLLLFVIFGVPSQMPTILGLAGAGLTVALQDFIISFLGWFVLMGRHGVRVGDWVEINGVAGEVVEVGLLRTVLLETGNWTDAGQPTGRKVAFMNSYAIQGHFFNFSTSGQWLWDELQVMVTSDRDPYPIIAAIEAMVSKETEADTTAAEQEWQQATTRYHVQAVSAKPAVNLRPTAGGIEVHIRYITRANERYAMRTRLYQAVVELLRKKAPDAALETPPAAAAKR
jgi:small-conductance mechanosensitive channel